MATKTVPMPTLTMPTKLRIATIALAFTIAQQANAFGFEKPSATSKHVQLASAVLSLPLTIAAQKHPDSKALACLEHAVKAINEYTACNNTNALYNGPWFLYDTYKTIELLFALIKSSTNTDQNELDNNDITQTEIDAIINEELPSNDKSPAATAGEQHIKRIARTLLASIEGVSRILMALQNNKKNPQMADGYWAYYLALCKALLPNICSLVRTTNNSLVSNKKQKAYWQALICAHILAAYAAYHHYKVTQQEAIPTPQNQLSEEECLQILHLPDTATLGDIEHTFRRLGLTEHPDKKSPTEHAAATRNWQRISQARNTLKDIYHKDESTKQPAAPITQDIQSPSLNGVD